MISIIDYRAGNLTSVERALKHLGVPCRITEKPREIASSERVIFPGVGAAGKAMEIIKSRNLDKVIHDVIARKIPFLGICLGAQIILDGSEEDDTTYEVWINDGRTPMGIDAVEWAKKAQDLGSGEICLNSIDADGSNEGYELTLTSLISETVTIPLIASGGAGNPEHLRDVFVEAGAEAALIASMVHYGRYTVGQIKASLAKEGIPVREFI